ncbi:hypothetical protein A2U01_0114296 [Trifolium medium]|uniref:Uncharacterized protein n=1 Tax=Trifolium medium TaxID=97028 RepID=A0A392VX82_9FABA|nr:hypothetical protein [Trifolium medium]
MARRATPACATRNSQKLFNHQQLVWRNAPIPLRGAHIPEAFPTFNS